MKKIIEKIFGKRRKTSPRDFEKQFKILKDKGLSIPVMTI